MEGKKILHLEELGTLHGLGANPFIRAMSKDEKSEGEEDAIFLGRLRESAIEYLRAA